MSAPRLLPLLAVATLLALLLAASLLAVQSGAPALAAHIGFALGVMPLILAAMSYFVPVLTRGAGAGLAAWLPPLLALATRYWSRLGKLSQMMVLHWRMEFIRAWSNLPKRCRR